MPATRGQKQDDVDVVKTSNFRQEDLIARVTLGRDTKRNLEHSFDDKAAASSIATSWSGPAAHDEYGSSVGASWTYLPSH